MKTQPDPRIQAAAEVALRRLRAHRRRVAGTDARAARIAVAHREWRRALNIAALTDDDDVDDDLLAGIVSACEELRAARRVLRVAGGEG